MNRQKLEKTLQNNGLTDKESVVYLAILQTGATTALKLARLSGINRSTVYTILESLRLKGLVRIELVGLKQLFAPEPPAVLARVSAAHQEELSASLNELSALYNMRGDESVVKYYEGLNAVKSVYEQVLAEIKPHDDYLVVTDIDQWLALDEKYFRKFVERRAKKISLQTKLLLRDSESAQKFKQFERNYNEQIKILPKDMVFSTNLIITPNKLVIHQLVPPVSAIVIENKQAIQLQKELFMTLWTLLKD